MNTGTYTWRIVDPNLIRKIQSAKCGDWFRSDVFQVVELNWKIKLCPNGWKEQNKGYCGVYVLFGTPSSWRSMFCQLHIECPQLQNTMVSSLSYNKPKSCGFYISSFEDLKASCEEELTFVI
eukprot:848031_1